jgi:excisionase family DNA binding protein
MSDGRRRRRGGRAVSATELATFCGVDLKTIHNWESRGKIRGWRTPGRHLRFRRLDVVDFLRAYEFALPEALTGARPHVVVIDADAAELAAARRALARRFVVEAFDDVVEGLVKLTAIDPDVLVLGDVSPLEPGAVVARLAAVEATRLVRVVTVGSLPPGATASSPRGDAGLLREVVERVTGVE